MNLFNSTKDESRKKPRIKIRRGGFSDNAVDYFSAYECHANL